MDEAHRRPDGVSDATVSAVGKMTEALEWVERARGHLYDFHHMMGHADALFGEAADDLADAGHIDEADCVRSEVVGRNALDGRWSYQIVEEFDGLYWMAVREQERLVTERLLGGRRHVHEAEMKQTRHKPHRANTRRAEG